MGKIHWLKLTLFRIVGISVLIIILIYWGLNRNPALSGKLKKIIFPAINVTPSKWVLENRQIYTLCGHTEIRRNDYRLDGPFKTVIKTHSKQIKKINDHLYVYAKRVSGFCSSCRKNQFLGLENHLIMVFRGTPQKPGPVVEKIPIDPDKLPEAELEDLRKGIPFRDGKEKLQLLEGLNGLSTE